jgi:tripartite-type tricarboxylate transporter receptor subunit TctC
MMMIRHSNGLWAALATGAAFTLSASGVIAQQWPTKAITLIVPFATGGGVDASARVQVQALGDILGQNFVIENVGGAAGTIGSAKAAKAKPDGYTLLIGNSGTHGYSQSLYNKKPYDSVKDFEPVGLVSESPRILIARKDLPVNGMKEFVAYAKANQKKMQYGSAGVGAGTHLPCALLNINMGVDIIHIPFRGAGPVMQEIMAGRIDYMCDTIQTGAARAKSGQVKGIAVMSAKRVPVIPDLATTGEQGFPGLEASVWNAFFFPKGTPKPIVMKLNGAIQQMLARPDVKKRLEGFGLEILPPEERTPEYLAKFLPREIARWGKVIEAAGIKKK